MGSKKGKELDIAQQISFLKKINFFNEFGDEELLSFLSVSRWLKVPAGKLIIKEETSDRIFYILVKGEVSVFKTIDDKGATVELTTLTTGDCFGEMSMVMEIKRSAGVKTTMESFILMVEPDIISASNVFLQLKFYKRFCEILVSRLILANKRVTCMEPQDEEAAQDKKTTPAVEEKEPEKEETSAEQPAIIATEGEKVPEKPVDSATLPPMPLAEEKFGRSRIQRMLSPEQNMVVNPAVAAELSSFLAQESTSNTRKFADLIVLDPVLSAKVLQIANSSFYRRSNAVVSVPHAMITLGIEHILTVVMETLESSRYKHPFSGFPQLSKSFWEHAVVVGRIAELLKDIIRVNISIDIYLAGLFHDFGMLGLDILKPAFYPQLLDPDSDFSTNLVQSEADYIGIDHGQAGAWLGEKIGIPAPYLEIMKFHHKPDKGRANTLPLALVHLADIFAHERGIGICGSEAEITSPLESSAWVLIQDQHKPFIEVNVVDFVASFNEELTKMWGSITAGIPL